MSYVQRCLECMVRVVVMALLLSSVSAARAQCESMWLPGSSLPGVSHASGAIVNAVLNYDPDGPGPLPEVVALGGLFTWAGNSPAAGVVLWNPVDGSWTPLGTELNGEVRALATCPTGTGGFDLYASGGFSANASVWRWNGAAWTALPSNGITTILDMAAVPNSVGGYSLIACGSGSNGSLKGIARWDGTAWSAMGSGAVSGTTVYDVEPVQRPDGTWDVFAAGVFATASGSGAYGVARWDGTAWNSLGATSLNSQGTVLSLASLPNGSGGYDLIAGGQLSRIAGVQVAHLARWDGTQWSNFGGVSGVGVQKLRATDMELGGPNLLVVGNFVSVAGVAAKNVARWNGVGWSSLSVGTVTPGTNLFRDIARVPGGEQDDFLVGGFFETIDDGAPALSVARREGSHWSPIARDEDLHAPSSGIYVLPTASGESDLLVGQHWDKALRQWGPARWNGSRWELLGTGLTYVYRFAHHRNALGEIDLYGISSRVLPSGVREYFVAKMEGDAWIPIGTASGSGQTLYSIAIAPTSDGSLRLYVGGVFDQVGGVPCRNIALWDGATWSQVGADTSQFGATTIALLPNSDGGFDPIVGGGGSNSGYVFRFDGSQWLSLGPAFDRKVYSVLVAPNSDGTCSLYAGGYFAQYNGGVAQWTGTGWTSLAGGLATSTLNGVLALAWVPDALRGHRLVAGGNANLVRTGPASRIGLWNGVAWTALDPSPAGVFQVVTQPHRDGTDDIVVDTGQWAYHVGGTPSAFIARFATVCSCPADLDNDGDFPNGLTRDGAVTIEDLLAFLVGFEAGDVAVDLDDGTGTGIPDGAITIDDLLYFLIHFEAGC